MTIERWKLRKVWKEKRQGHVWIVTSNLGRQGYFKFAKAEHKYYSGTMIANEWIAAMLAEKLGFPVAELQLATIIGPDGVVQDGLVSVKVKASEIATWRSVDKNVRHKAERYVNHVELFRMVVVFDAWITNVDRAAGKNLVLYRNDAKANYDWYLIDHGLSLYGSPNKWRRHEWNASYWQKLWMFHHVPEGMLRLQSSLQELEPMISRIEAMSDQEIDHVLAIGSRQLCDESERQFIRQLLISRRSQLRQMIQNWVEYKGVKEYNGK